MNATANWQQANQRYLSAALAVVRHHLEKHAARAQGASLPGEQMDGAEQMPGEAVAMSAPPALEALCAGFALSPFERDLLLLCAGVELDASFAACCAAAQGETRRITPTFSLALAALREAHWSALAPTGPLRRWRLIEVGNGDTLTLSPLHIDERILHFLAGIPSLDARLQVLIEPVRVPGTLPPSQRALAARIASLWAQEDGAAGAPLIQLCGADVADKRAIAAAACAALGLQLYALSASDIPFAASEREALARLWEREAILSGSALLVEADDLEGADQTRKVVAFVEHVSGLVLLATREPLRLRTRPAIRLDARRPSASEQRTLWQETLGPLAPKLNGHLEELATQFNLGAAAIQSASAEVLGNLAAVEEVALAALLWDACRSQARARLDDLAQHIEPAAAWDDLVLPEMQREVLRDIAVHVRQRTTVYERWGFAAKSARGLGISALFAGSSGTGKTMAAEVLANELRLDLYRIDLSQVVSKYIGETEKNLRRVFDAAEEGGAILLFDEADALFGKRSEVKDSHDRYANIEVGYLLQRMEAYRGLAILTTNMKDALDTAFLRRIRFIVHFPFPDAAQRAEIWRRIFPASTPTDGLDMNKLARLNVPGGNIRNIALNAAFLAANAGESVCMAHLLRAARSEYLKLEKPLTEAEIGGWV